MEGQSQGWSADQNDVTVDPLVAAFDQIGEISASRFVPGLAPRRVVTAGEDDTLAIWPVRTEDLADHACLRLQAILGAEAWKGDCRWDIERSCSATMAGHQ